MMVQFRWSRKPDVLVFTGTDDFGNEYALGHDVLAVPMASVVDGPFAIETYGLPVRVLLTAMAFCEVNGDEAIH